MSGGDPCLSIGQAIGSYRVVRQLGEGGMGEVYEVFDKELDRRAALKVVSPELARNTDVVTRFQREAKAMSQLRHPGIVHVFVYGVLPVLRGAPYFIMEYLEGDTLRARIQQASKEPEGRLGITYLPILQQVAKALAAVHQRGLVHRDLKPSKVTTDRENGKTVPPPGEVLAAHRLWRGTMECGLIPCRSNRDFVALASATCGRRGARFDGRDGVL
jgi:serine/threonine protein kinase